MGKLLYLSLVLLLYPFLVTAQAPSISYVSPKTYTVGTTISALIPSNSGGAVPATIYGQVSIFAGTGSPGAANGTGTAASFNGHYDVAADAQGNIYVAEVANNLIRKVTPGGVVTTFAGSGATGSVNGSGTSASFNYPSAVTVDSQGNIYVADTYNNLIRKITSAGVVTTFAGSGLFGSADGTGTAASFYFPNGLAVDASDNVYVADTYSEKIRKITPAGVVTTLAGSGSIGSADGTGNSASFWFPADVAVDSQGNIFVADSFNNLIRKITPAGVVTTLAGSTTAGSADGIGTVATFHDPHNITIDAIGNLYLGDAQNNLIRKITPAGVVSTLAGTGTGGSANGIGTAASFSSPFGVAVDNLGNLYVDDVQNYVIRNVILTGYTIDKTLPAGLSFDATTGTFSGTPTATSPATNYTITAYNTGGSSSFTVNIAVNLVPAPNISYVTPQTYTVGTAISALSPTNSGGPVPATIYGQVSTFAGSGVEGSANGTGTAASFKGPYGIAADVSGNIYVAEIANNLIRKITPTGVVTTLAGNGTSGSANGSGTSATFNSPYGITVDVAGNVYVGDSYNNLIRKININGIVSTFAGTGSYGYADGAGTLASFKLPTGLTTDSQGNIYVADEGGNLIRKITPAGTVSTVAGNGAQGGINGVGTGASFFDPLGVAKDASGSVFVADEGNKQIRMVTPGGIVSTFAGSGSTAYIDGTGISASFDNPLGLTTDAVGNVYVADREGQAIRKITPSGVVTTLAGNPETAGYVDGTGNNARFNQPWAVTSDLYGNLYVSDQGNNVIRKISITGYTIDKTLPAGLNFDATTGVISGTPTVTSPATDYTITAYNTGGTSSFTVNITVSLMPPTIAATGSLSALSTNYGTASSSTSFNVSGTNLTTGILITPPNGFEVSTDNITFRSTVTVGSSGNITSTPVYVRLAANATVGSHSGNMVLSSSGAASVNLSVLNSTVNPSAPNISYVTPQTYTVGTTISVLQPSNSGGPVPAAVYGAVSTFAGSGAIGSANGFGSAASFYNPFNLATDYLGNVYVADGNNLIIRKITPAGVVSTFAGSGLPGHADGTGTAASFLLPYNVATDIQGNVYVTDEANYLIRKITPGGVVSTIAGSGIVGGSDGPALTASFDHLFGITVDGQNNIYVSQSGGEIRKITPGGIVSTPAHCNQFECLYSAGGLASDNQGNIYIPDHYNSSVYKLSSSNQFTSFAGTYQVVGANNGTASSSTFNAPLSVATDLQGNLYVADALNNLIRKITPSLMVTTLAGDGSAGSVDGVGSNASFHYPSGVATDAFGNLYVSDAANNKIRSISLTGYSIDKTLPAGLSFDATTGIISGTPTVTSPATDYTITAYNTGGSSSFKVNITISLIPPTIAATGSLSALSTTYGTASSSTSFNVSGTNLTTGILITPPSGFEVSTDNITFSSTVTVGSSGNITSTSVYVRLAANATVGSHSGNIVLSSSGATNVNVPTVNSTVNPAPPTINYASPQTYTVGSAISPLSPTTSEVATPAYNGTPIVIASGFHVPSYDAVDAAGNVYVADGIDHALYKIATNGTIVNIAYFTNAIGVAVDANGNIFVADDINNAANNTIYEIPASGGSQISLGSTFNNPRGVAVDAAGNVYVAEQGNNDVVKIPAGGGSPTIIGTGFSGPYGVAVDSHGNVYVADGSGGVKKIAASGGSAVSVGSGFNNVQGVAVDGAGNVYVADYGGGHVYEIMAGGGLQVTLGSGFFGPYGIAVDHSGNVYVVDLTNNSVKEIKPVGGYFISPGLPAGLTFDTNTGIISGTPTAASPATNYTITAYNSGGNTSTVVNITVNQIPPSITAGIATGTISACAGTASASPNIQQFTGSGLNLTADISATAPTGFEVSLAAGSGYGNSVTLTQSAGSINSTTVYVRSAATASGNISGNVVLSSTGAISQNVAVTGTINALPTVNPLSNQTLLNGAATTIVNFTGTGNTFTWTNDTPGIGLAASGTGDIASFTAVNNGSSPVTATITATPVTSGFAYIANRLDNSVSVINISTNTVVATIPVEQGPFAVAVSPIGNHAYVTHLNDNNISVINTITNTLETSISLGSRSTCAVVSPDGSRLYVSDSNSSNVFVVNTLSNALVATIVVGTGPRGVSISPDGNSVYVANNSSNNVSVINTVTNAVTATIPIGSGPYGIVVSPDGSHVYATNEFDGTVSVISTTTNSVATTISVGLEPYSIAISKDGSSLFVTCANANSVSRINTATNTMVTTIPVGQSPFGVALGQNGSQLYVVNSVSNNVSVINTATNAVALTIPVGAGPDSFASFTTSGIACSGAPVTFTITVNPTAPTITASTATGTISACAGTASASPNIQQFTVSGTYLTANITATAPTGFEVSLSSGSGYSNSVTLTPSGGSVSSTTVYVRSAASASGSISGNVVLSSTGATSQNVAVAGTVNALPTVNTVANQSLLNGASTTAVNFTGTANTFTWTNDTPGIGLAASGTGNIASFAAVNNGSSPVTATITATPVSMPFAYIANNNDGTVSVIDLSTNTVKTTITVGSHPFGVTVSPDGSKVYVANFDSNTVSVINTVTNTVIATIATGLNPYGLLISPDGSKLYISNDGTVAIVNTASNIITSTIAVGANLEGMAISPDGGTLYAVNQRDNIVYVVNLLTNSTITAINVGSGPAFACITPDGNKLYITNTGANTISVINTSTNSVIKTISGGTNPTGISVSPDGSRIYVANHGSAGVSVINTETDLVVATISVGNVPHGVSVTADDSRLYVTNFGSNTVSAINTSTNQVIANINVGVGPLSDGHFITNGIGCTGTPTTFTITVNPTPPTIIASTATGAISACAGLASASPNIQQFTVSGTQLTADIIATAPTGFEVSLNAASGYGNSVTLSRSSGSVSTTTLYVRSTATASGSISGNVVLSSTDAVSQNVPVAGTVNALPTVNTVVNQSLLNGASTNAINFTGIGNTFTWTNDTPGIGLAASGTGDIASFTAVNNGSSPVMATISATPISPGFAYIENEDDDYISVINTSTNTVIARISAGQSPTGIAISPDKSRLYIVSQRSNTVTVVSTLTNTATATIPVGQNPIGICVSPDGNRVYVANNNFNSVSVINCSTNTIVATIAVGFGPGGIAISPDGSKLYVTNQGSSTISVINTVTNVVVSNIAVGTTPTGISTSPDGTRLYVTNVDDGTVSVINTLTGSVISTIPVGTIPIGVTVSPDGTKVFVANETANSVSVINTSTDAVVSTITVGSRPFGISITPDGQKVYVSNTSSNDVTVINALTNSIITTIGVGLYPVSFGNFVTSGTGCTGTPITFTITVNPTLTTISTTGSLSALSTTYGTPSTSSRFNISGVNLTAGILVAPPSGFEVSTDNVNYSGTVTVGAAGNVSSTAVYIRLAATTAVGSYFGNIVLSSAGATNINVATINSTVTPAPLTITANNINKTYGSTLTGATGSTAFTSTGLKNGETVGSVTIAYGAGSAANAAVGTYAGSVTPYAASGGTFSASNYAITYIPGNIIVGKATLTITASNANKTYGSTLTGTAGSTAFTTSGLQNGETVGSVTIAYGTGSAATASIGTYSGSITPSVATGGTFTATDYNITYATGDITVGKATLSITANNVNKSYGSTLTGASGSAAFTSTGLQNSETVGSLTMAYGTGAAATANVGTYTGSVTPSAATGGTFAPGNYNITYAAGNITVGKATLTITANTVNKTYGATLTGTTGSTAFTSTGLQNGETAGSVTMAYGTGSAANVAVGTYSGSVTSSAATGGTFTAANYNITYAPGNIILGKAALTITANAVSKTYGTALTGATGSTAFTSTGLQNSETIGSTTVSYGAGSAANAAVGTYPNSITLSAATGGTFNSGNYAITYNPGNIIVGKAALNITANNANKTYGSTLTGSTGSTAFFSAGLQNGETIGGVNLAYGAGSAATDAVGTYTGSIIPSNAVAGTFNASNYNINYMPGNIAVGQATLTITVSAVNKTYGATLTSSTSSTAFTASGLLNGETVGTVSVVYGTGSAANAVVGNYFASVTPFAATGGTFTVSNYHIVYVPGAILVNPAALTITATNVTKTYGTVLAGATGSSAFTALGLQNSETIGSVTMAYGTGAAATVGVGTYNNSVAPSLAFGGTFIASNYTITYVMGNITVSNAALTITATTVNKIYGVTLTGGNVSAGFTIAGLQNGETVGSISIVYGAGSAPTAAVGTYTGSVSPSSATGGTFAPGNYSITYAAADIVVGKAILAISANDVSKIYGAVLNRSANSTAYTVLGLQNGETTGNVNISYGSGSASTDAVGSYIGSVTASSATGGTFNQSNYALTYTKGNILVGPATITIVANTVIKTYGSSLSGGPGSTAFVVTGLQNNEAIGSLTTAYNAGAVATADVGTYPGSVILSNPVGGSFTAGNYLITFTAGDVKVNAATLTITAGDVNKKYGSILNGGTGSTAFTAAGLQNSETVGSTTVNYGSGSAATDPVGVYNGSVTISASSGGTFKASNYSINYQGGSIIVEPAVLTIIAKDIHKIYGTALLGGSGSTLFTVTGLQNAETISAVTMDYGTGALATDPVGTYTMSETPSNAAGGAFLANNYTINYVPGNIVVDKAALTITASNVTKTYGNSISGANGSKAFITTGLKNGENIGSFSVSYNLGAAATDGAGGYSGSVVGSNALGGTFNAGNYDITYTNGDIIVAKATITITADDKVKTYGSPNPVLTATYKGFVNNEGTAQLTALPLISTIALPNSPVGQYAIIASTASSLNYDFVYIPGTLTIKPSAAMVFIPNTFTPNDDGFNDTWVIRYLNYFPNCTVDIFTRYGSKIYSSKGYGVSWDGTYKGTMLPTGAYYYIIDLHDGSKILAGSITILR